MPDDDRDWVPTREIAYTTWVSFAQEAETNSWSRFYNFLVFTTILILAWSTIYVQTNSPKGAGIVMFMITILGVISGVAWSGLAYRSRKYVDAFTEGGAKLEEHADPDCRVCTCALKSHRAL